MLKIILKKKNRDPRFDGLSGKFNKDFYDKSYGFLKNLKEKEINILEKEVKKKKYNEEEKKKLKNILSTSKNEVNSEKYLDKKLEIKKKFKKNIKDSIMNKKKPFFPKQCNKNFKYI